ncbi:hypothetical protein [Paraburkholderia bryophila]|uniref:Uncharacterized protein n=1 Tax=Paraburkholderia bryophila TaxID=420952 RepID=A0A329D6Z0_9BURK|nr:hypothetical protein [Paraburkholderia bryophila]RAS38305.1 hypothetical protein BX591_102601 [Paraburkholderia bryophila]
MADILHIPVVCQPKGRRRTRPRSEMPLTSAVSLQTYRENIDLSSGLAAVKEMQRDSYIHLTVNAFGDITYDCHVNCVNIERFMDVLVLLLVRARMVRTKGSASYQSE